MSIRKVEITLNHHRYAAELHENDTVTIWRDDSPLGDAEWDGMIWGYGGPDLGQDQDLILDLLQDALDENDEG